MQLYADIARQCIANRVAYSPRQEFPISNYGDNSSITIQQMALDAIIDVKPAMAKKINEKTLAANALQIAANFGQSGLINKAGVSKMIELALMGTVPRKIAESFVQEQGPSPEEVALAQQQAQNEAMALQQNQQAYERDPASYETENIMDSRSPEEIDQIIAGLGQGGGQEMPGGAGPSQMQESGPEGIDMEQQDGAMVSELEGQTAESGSDLANPNGMLG
jgi:hypothetical protein